MRIAIIMLMSTILTACAAQFAKIDDSKCQSYGARTGTPAYVQCRAQMDAARTQSNATRGTIIPIAPLGDYR
jgi:hypothetical protein